MATAVWLAAVGCGESSGDAGPARAGAGQANAGDAGSTSASGAAAAGGSKAGSGSSSAGTSSGAAQGGSSSGTGNDEAGAPAQAEGGGPSGGLVDCDARKVLCKLLPTDCPGAFEVHAVEGTCWGDCVKIDQCACNAAADCPDPNQFTCWASEHCGPYVQ